MSDQEETAVAFAKLKAALQADTDYAWGWQSNLAMAIYDESRPLNPLSAQFCNNAAARFMKICFDVDVKASPEWAARGGDSILNASEIG